MSILLNNKVTKSDYTVVNFDSGDDVVDVLRLSKIMVGVLNRRNGVTPPQRQKPVSAAGSAGSAQARAAQQKTERESLVLWRRPISTVTFFTREIIFHTVTLFNRLRNHKVVVAQSLVNILLLFLLLKADGPHQVVVNPVQKYFLRCSYWLILGVMSSVGLGTGLHTFVLYLGPFIAQVTLAAYECHSLDFPEPPYPDEIICPSEERSGAVIDIWQIMSKVCLEAMMWGVGTAVGELPPYFVARAAAQSTGLDMEDEDEIKEFKELQKRKETDPDSLNFVDRGKLMVERVVKKAGFFGILACASIPNPLFDLAGITCGHFQIPFWTFFGATLIGKALVKSTMQQVFVIVAFSETLFKQFLDILAAVPLVGEMVREPFLRHLESQRQKLRCPSCSRSEDNIIGIIFSAVVFIMISYFLVTMVNALAQAAHKRQCKKGRNRDS